MESVLSKSLQILPDLCGSICSCLKLIVVDYWPVCEWIELPAFPSLQKFPTFLVNMASGEYFSTDLLSVWRCQLAAAYGGGSCSRGCHGYLPALAWSVQVPANLQGTRGPFLESPETFWVTQFSLYLQNEGVPWNEILQLFNFYSLYIWKDQLYSMSGLQFYKWLFGPETSSGLSRNWAQFPSSTIGDEFKLTSETQSLPPYKWKERRGVL